MSNITIRAIRPDDKERIAAAFRALERDSVYLRFFCHKKELSDAELRWATERDGMSKAALVATIGSGERETIVGLGEYACNGGAAEVAFTVEEDFQRRGIATRLFQELAAIARRNGVAQLEADVLAENTPMLNLLRRAGLPMRETREDGVVHATLFLT